MRVETDPAAQLSEAMAAVAVRAPPLRHPDHRLDARDRGARTAQHALAYYRRFYTPENAILVVAGDVDADEVRRLADGTYGRIAPRGERPTRLRPREPEPRAARHVAVADPKVEQPTLQRLYLAPSCPHRARAATATRSSFSPRCSAAGRPPTSTASSSWSAASPSTPAPGTWARPSTTPASRSTRCRRRASPSRRSRRPSTPRSRRSPPRRSTPDAIERAKTRLVAETIYSTDSQSSLARIYGSALAIGETIEDVRRWPSRDRGGAARRTSPRVAERYLVPRRSVTGYLTKTPA